MYVHVCIEWMLKGYLAIFGKCAYLLSLPVFDEKINITLMSVCTELEPKCDKHG